MIEIYKKVVWYINLLVRILILGKSERGCSYELYSKR